MKKNILFLFCALACLAASAQEKYFDEALRQGRTLKSFYQIKNEKQKMIKVDDLIKYSKQKGYIMGKYTRKEMGRFGDVAITIKTFDFIPSSEFPQYICENLTGQSSSNFKSKGTVYFYEPGGNEYFRRYDNVMWTGEVKNGRIHGQGIGFKQADATNYISFTGTFNEGILQGEGQFYTYNQSSEKTYYVADWQKHLTGKTGRTVEGMTWFASNNKYGFINADGHAVVQPLYSRVNDYSNGYALAQEDGIEVKLDKSGNVSALADASKLSYSEMLAVKKKHPQLTKAIQSQVATTIGTSDFAHLMEIDKDFPDLAQQTLTRKKAIYSQDCSKLSSVYQKAKSEAAGNRVDLSGQSFINTFINDYGSRFKFDPDNKVGTAKQLRDYYSVCNALQLKPSSSYYSWGRPPSFSDGGQPAMLERAISLCNDSPADFKGFCNYAKPQIASNLTKVRSKLSQDRSAYNSAMNQYRRERDDELAALESMSLSEVLNRISSKGKWSRGRVFDSDDDYTDHRYIIFKDGISFSIDETYYNKGYYRHYYKAPYVYEQFSTESEAIYAGYKEYKRKQIIDNYPGL